jgi:hypothetical protein
VPLAKNLAVRRSIGSYIALHDADDEFCPEKVARCMKTLEDNPKTHLLTHDYRFIDSATGETFIPGDDWFGDWRPPGVWVFPAGQVNFNEQMVCGYEELEWSMRFWRALDRVHIPAPLSVVHGQYLTDRWKVDREIAGVESMKRWKSDVKNKRGLKAFACRGCGNQYFNQIVCCDELTVEVPLVCYMAVASAPSHAPIEFSIVIFMRNNLAATRRLVTTWRQDPEAKQAEWVFVNSNPRKDVLAYLRVLAEETRVKAVFTPRQHPHVYSHDANRAARCADGSLLVFLDSRTELRNPVVLSVMRQTLSDRRVGIAGVGLTDGITAKFRLGETAGAANHNGRDPLARSCYGLRQDVFWELGAIDEGFEGDGIETLDLQFRTLKHHYLLAQADVPITFRSHSHKVSRTAADSTNFLRKHDLRRRKTGNQIATFPRRQLPEISIAMATRNEARFLARCLHSVLRSAKRARVPFQVVVVDDCSTDGTRLVLEEYRKRFSGNLTLLHSERTLGPARARNLALSRCVGTYVASLDATHEFRRDKLITCLSILRRSGADFLFHDVGLQKRSQPNTARQRTPAYSCWMFRNGLVRFGEQWVAEGSEREWFKRRAPSLKTVHSPLRLAQRQNHATRNSGISLR